MDISPEVGYWGLPLGCRFHPTDQELVSYLRKRAVAGEPLGIPFLHEFNLYGNTQPWVVWETFGGNSFLDQDLFFFYELQYSKKNIKRSIDAGGSWKATSFAPVEALDGSPIGEKRNFTYKNKGCEYHGDWLLEEHTLLPNPDLKVARNNFVISRLKRSPKSRCANMNSTQQLNEKPPIKKRARIEASNEKLPIEKRARKEPGVITITIDQSNTPHVVPFDEIECNINHDYECIGNINGSAAMPINDVSAYPICFGSEEEFLVGNEECNMNHGGGCISNINGSAATPVNDVSTYPICFGSEEEILLGDEEYRTLREIEDLLLSDEGGDFPSD